MTSPSPQFVESVTANLDHWRERTTTLAEQQFGAFDVDWPNIMRAVRFGHRLPALWAIVADLALSLFNLAERRGYWREWTPVLEALTRTCPPEDYGRRGQLLYQIGNFRRLERRLPEAVAAHREAENILRAGGDEIQTALMRYALSEDYRYQRQYEEAERWGLAALNDFERLGLSASGKAGAVLNTLGLIAYAQGHLATAEERLAQAVALWKQEQAPTELARALNNLGIVLQAAGKTEPAIESYSQAKDLLSQTQSEFDKVMVELSLGTLYFNAGDLAGAEAAFRRADSPFLKRSGHIYYRAMTANNLGNVLLERGQLEEAESHLRAGLRLYRQIQDEVMMANTLGTLAEVLDKQGQASSALQVYEEAVTLLVRYLDDAWARYLHDKLTAKRQQLLEKT